MILHNYKMIYYRLVLLVRRDTKTYMLNLIKLTPSSVTQNTLAHTRS